MTAPELPFDQPETLPYQGKSVTSRAASRSGAVQAAKTFGA